MAKPPFGSDIHSTVVVIEVAVPLTQALDGGAAIATQAVVLQLGPEVGGGEACRCQCA
jgi:hypothetical protein